MDERAAVAAMRRGLGIKNEVDADFGVFESKEPEQVFASVDHARHGTTPPDEPLEVWAFRAIGAAVSDVACSGTEQVYVQVDLQVPRLATSVELESVGRGIRTAVNRYNAILLNGNNTTTNHDGPYKLSTVVHGTRRSCLTQPPGRSGAAPGDIVACSRLPGMFNASLRELNLGVTSNRTAATWLLGGLADLAVGRAIVDAGLATAIIDLNDALLIGADDLARSSGTVIEIDSRNLHAHAIEAGILLEDVLSPPSGDLAILFTTPSATWDQCRYLVQAAGGNVVELGVCRSGTPGVTVSSWSRADVADVASRQWVPSEDFRYPKESVCAALHAL